jgi:hypothetical protein
MEETQKFFEPTPVDRDATLVAEPDGTLATPRFDEVEAQVARPVVPLANSRSARRPNRQWPIALVLISALAGGAVSLFAFRLYQQRSQVAGTQSGDQQVMPAAPTPEPTLSVETAATEGQTQTESPLIFEEFDPAKEVIEGRNATPVRETEAKPAVTRRDTGKDEAKPVAATAAPRTVGASPRREESNSAPRQVEATHDDVRHDDRTDEDIFVERRERRRERREQRREQRRDPKRNIDRIKDIFEGAPPA